jgi:hypothetical protein
MGQKKPSEEFVSTHTTVYSSIGFGKTVYSSIRFGETVYSSVGFAKQTCIVKTKKSIDIVFARTVPKAK